MSDPDAPHKLAPRPSKWARSLRLGLLLACLAGLVAYVISSSSSDTAGREATPSTLACAGSGTPQVLSVAPTQLGALRSSVARVLPGRVGRLYEEGTISASNMWSDNPPSGPTVSTTARREGGYEMRWWAPNGDDLVADVLLFGSSAQAAAFVQRASERRCGHALLRSSADRPPLARNLAWMNPDGFGEADVYLARGRRVYRVGDVPAAEGARRPSPARLRRTLYTVDALACLLPDAHCEGERLSVPA